MKVTTVEAVQYEKKVEQDRWLKKKLLKDYEDNECKKENCGKWRKRVLRNSGENLQG